MGFKFRLQEKLQDESQIFQCLPWQSPQKQAVPSNELQFICSCLRAAPHCGEQGCAREWFSFFFFLALKIWTRYDRNNLPEFGWDALIILCRRDVLVLMLRRNERKPWSREAVKCPYGWGSQPAVLVLRSVHVPVEGVELVVAEVFHVQQVKLAPCIVVTLVVPCPGEIQPLGMTKLIPCNTHSREGSRCGRRGGKGFFWRIQIQLRCAQ